MVLRILIILGLLLAVISGVSLASENSQAAVASDTSAEITYPGLGELGSRTTAVTAFVGKAEEQLVQVAQLADAEQRLHELTKQLTGLNDEIKPFGPPEDWYVDRLSLYIRQYAQLQEGLASLQDSLANRQGQIDAVRKRLTTEQEFWKGWAASLSDRQQKLPPQTLTQVNQQLTKLNKATGSSSLKIVSLQEKISVLQGGLIATIDHLTSSLERLRQATFRKNAPSFVSSRFYQQFTPGLLDEARKGLLTALRVDPSFWEEGGLSLALMFVLFCGGSGTIWYYRKRFEQTEEWQFVLSHPLAVGCFLAVILFWWLTPSIPTLVRFLLQVAAVLSAVIMTMSLVENRRQGLTLWFAGIISLVTSGVRMASLPQPLFRTYIALLALIFIPLLLQQIKYSRKQRGTAQGKLFRAVSRLAIIVLAVSFVGQLAGFINFSTWLIQATFETALTILFVHMILLLAGGAIDVSLTFFQYRQRDFFLRFGYELATRLKRLLKVLIVGFAVVYLLPVWRIFTTFNEAWNGILSVGFTFGETYITVEMLGLAFFSFYLAMQISWLLQGMSDTQLFARRTVDRGVRDAIKKLIHYAIILIGFLIALGFVGMKLQNFIVLLSAFGVGIGFGLQDIVNNFLSGLILLFERPIKVGDGVLIDNEYGTVSRIGLRSTVVENLNQAELIVPNSQIISQKVTNWTLSNRRVRLVLPVGVAYGSDLEKVLAILTRVAAEHPDVMKDPKPMPLFIQFGGSSLDFELRVWLDNIDNRPRVQNELLLAIDRCFRIEGIEIPFPQHDLHLRSVAPGIFSSGKLAGFAGDDNPPGSEGSEPELT